MENTVCVAKEEGTEILIVFVLLQLTLSSFFHVLLWYQTLQNTVLGNARNDKDGSTARLVDTPVERQGLRCIHERICCTR
jgi:hypothetical protein